MLSPGLDGAHILASRLLIWGIRAAGTVHTQAVCSALLPTNIGLSDLTVVVWAQCRAGRRRWTNGEALGRMQRRHLWLLNRIGVLELIGIVALRWCESLRFLLDREGSHMIRTLLLLLSIEVVERDRLRVML